MARARRRRGSALGVGLLFVVAAVGAAWWFRGEHRTYGMRSAQAPISSGPVAVVADHVDPANEGRTVAIDGALSVLRPARDLQLGVTADAVALLRHVEMLQWREKCAAAACDYKLEWSPQPIDSHAFKVASGHRNPAHLPFQSERFLAADVRLGAFRVDAAFAAAAFEPVVFPVRVTQLPPNLAATFRERDGMLYAGADPQHEAAGDVRVSYRIIASGERHLTGLQQGDRLTATPVR